MKIACIDIGTNSIRVLLADHRDSKFHNVEKQLQMTRLGLGVNETGILAADRMEESAAVISSFYKMAKEYGAEQVYMMATSAVRDAKNASEFTQEVYNRTGCIIDVISGTLEAEIGFLGVLLGLEDQSQNILVIDIGGGSTELIVGDLSGIKYAVSMNIGAVRLTGAYVHHDPVNDFESQQIKATAQAEIDKISDEIKKYNIDFCIGIGGTATTFATMKHEVAQYAREKVHGLKISASDIAQITDQLGKSKVEERQKRIGLESKRADIIYAGGIILESLMKSLEIEELIASDYDNLEGLVAYKSKK